MSACFWVCPVNMTSPTSDLSVWKSNNSVSPCRLDQRSTAGVGLLHETGYTQYNDDVFRVVDI